MELSLKVEDAGGTVLASTTGTDETVLVYRGAYGEGDRLVVEADSDGHIVLTLDDAIAPAPVYLRGGRHVFSVPFGQKRDSYSAKAFTGDCHRLFVRRARAEEVAAWRNLAFNPLDDASNAALFPHAHANVETRGEAVFAARNAIDGEKANTSHGSWPYTSWGINRDPDAALMLDFGRPVELGELVLYLRADFPHDAWWQKVSVTFSDGETLALSLEKTGRGQHFPFATRRVEWLKLHSLIKADGPSPYPALTQIEAWGREAGR